MQIYGFSLICDRFFPIFYIFAVKFKTKFNEILSSDIQNRGRSRPDAGVQRPLGRQLG